MFETHARPGATPAVVERALDFSKEVSDLMDLHHSSSVPVHRPQIAVAMALFMQALEHRQAIILLLVHGVRSSAAALVRPTFEACFRGVWALNVATDDHIRNMFGAHPHEPPLEKILQSLAKNPATRELAAYCSWKHAGDYVHSGTLQLSRWLGPEGIEPLHPDSDAVDMLELTDFCGLLACINMNEACGRNPSELLEKLTEVKLRAIARRAVEIYNRPESPSDPSNGHHDAPGVGEAESPP